MGLKGGGCVGSDGGRGNRGVARRRGPNVLGALHR